MLPLRCTSLSPFFAPSFYELRLVALETKNAARLGGQHFFAEREGFEPSVPLPVRQFSKLFLSATQASLRYYCLFISLWIFALVDSLVPNFRDSFRPLRHLSVKIKNPLSRTANIVIHTGCQKIFSINLLIIYCLMQAVCFRLCKALKCRLMQNQFSKTYSILTWYIPISMVLKIIFMVSISFKVISLSFN